MMKLMIGDCLQQMQHIADGSVDMVLADPPYGMTDCRWDTVIPLEPMWQQLRRVTKPNAAIVLTAAQPFTTTLISSNRRMFKYCWVWDKKHGTGFLNAKKQPLRNCEDVVVFYRQQPAYQPQMRTGFKPYVCWRAKKKSEVYRMQAAKPTLSVSDGSRYPLTRLEFLKDAERMHPTQKPVALMEYLIRTYTHKGETVLDFTMGSGTTGVACKRLDRDFIGIELDETYFNLARERIGSTQLPQVAA